MCDRCQVLVYGRSCVLVSAIIITIIIQSPNRHRDNVTVVVVDLSQQDDIPPGEEGVLEAVQAPLSTAGAIMEATPEDGATLEQLAPHHQQPVQMDGG